MAQARRSPKIAKPRERLHHVFVDFENVPTVDLALIGDLPAQVTLLIGEKQRRLDLGLVQQIHQYASKITLVEVGTSGRNALDLVLAWHLGRAVERFPEDPFFVVSKDKDFDPLLRHLVAHSISIARVDAFSHLPFLVPGAPVRKKLRGRRPAATITVPPTPELELSLVTAAPEMEPDARLSKLVARLQHKSKARPARKKSLLSYINGFYNKKISESEVEAILAKIQEGGIVQIDSRGRVGYPETAAPATFDNGDPL